MKSIALLFLVLASLVFTHPASATPWDFGATTITLTSTPNPSAVGEPVTFTATVAGTGSVPTSFLPEQATGVVTFMDAFNGATTVLATVGLGDGTAIYTTSALVLGSHVISCTYGGDAAHASSGSTAVIQVVAATPSTTTLSSSVNPSVVGQAFTLQANVTSNSKSPLTGSVRFFDGAALLGTMATSSKGVATLSVSNLDVGNHALTATYAEDPAIAESTGSLTLTVSKAQSTLSLAASSATTGQGSSVRFTAIVRPVAPATSMPTGEVTFANGSNSLGTATIDGSGTASFITSGLPVGTRSVTATFAGDAKHTGSTATLSRTTTENVAAVTVVSSPSPSKVGESVTITATVTTSAGAPAGVVTFKNGIVDLGTAALDANGVATFRSNALPLGTLTLVAEFDGAGFYASGSGSVAHVVESGDPSGPGTSAPNGEPGQPVNAPSSFDTASPSATVGPEDAAANDSTSGSSCSMSTGTSKAWPTMLPLLGFVLALARRRRR